MSAATPPVPDVAHLGDLTETALLSDAIDRGLISARAEGSLRILNYTPRATYDRAWNQATLTCRGWTPQRPDVRHRSRAPGGLRVHLGPAAAARDGRHPAVAVRRWRGSGQLAVTWTVAGRVMRVVELEAPREILVDPARRPRIVATDPLTVTSIRRFGSSRS